MSSEPSEQPNQRQRPRSSLLIPIIGAMIGFVAALFLLRELDIFEGDPAVVEPDLTSACDYPAGGYFDRLCKLVAQASFEIQTTIEPATAARCVDDNTDCRLHRENLRVGLPTSERFRDALFDLDPPEAAADWHQRYLTAVSLLHSGYHAQFSALQDNDRATFLAAHERTRSAATTSAALFDDFQIAFRDERAP